MERLGNQINRSDDVRLGLVSQLLSRGVRLQCVDDMRIQTRHHQLGRSIGRHITQTEEDRVLVLSIIGRRAKGEETSRLLR